jgi:AbrB family looped-hinge helix DNA binding protein
MKPIYRIIDETGRVYIPKAVRESAGVGAGDVLELRAGRDRITLVKAKITPPAPPTVEDILEMLEAVPKAALFEAAAKLTAMLGGDFYAKQR